MTFWGSVLKRTSQRHKHVLAPGPSDQLFCESPLRPALEEGMGAAYGDPKQSLLVFFLRKNTFCTSARTVL